MWKLKFENMPVYQLGPGPNWAMAQMTPCCMLSVYSLSVKCIKSCCRNSINNCIIIYICPSLNTTKHENTCLTNTTKHEKTRVCPLSKPHWHEKPRENTRTTRLSQPIFCFKHDNTRENTDLLINSCWWTCIFGLMTQN
jgi:hypothetical protein